jgi:hypothetical protein
MLLGGVVLFVRAPTRTRYLVLLAAAGLTGLIRPTVWFYGLGTAVVATAIAVSAMQSTHAQSAAFSRWNAAAPSWKTRNHIRLAVKWQVPIVGPRPQWQSPPSSPSVGGLSIVRSAVVMSGLLVVGGQTTDETAAGWWLCLHGHGVGDRAVVVDLGVGDAERVPAGVRAVVGARLDGVVAVAVQARLVAVDGGHGQAAGFGRGGPAGGALAADVGEWQAVDAAGHLLLGDVAEVFAASVAGPLHLDRAGAVVVDAVGGVCAGGCAGHGFLTGGSGGVVGGRWRWGRTVVGG